MKKPLVIGLLLAAIVALASYVAAGPYLALHGIRTALAEQDTARLERHVDFPALRVNLRVQVEDHLARQAGPDVSSSLFGAAALSLANQVLGRGVDTLVTPMGIAALLQGRATWKRAVGETASLRSSTGRWPGAMANAEHCKSLRNGPLIYGKRRLRTPLSSSSRSGTAMWQRASVCSRLRRSSATRSWARFCARQRRATAGASHGPLATAHTSSASCAPGC